MSWSTWHVSHNRICNHHDDVGQSVYIRKAPDVMCRFPRTVTYSPVLISIFKYIEVIRRSDISDMGNWETFIYTTDPLYIALATNQPLP